MLKTLHLAFTFTVIGLVAACSTESDPVAGGDAGMQAGGDGDGDGDGDPTAGDGDAGTGTGNNGDGDGDPAAGDGDGDPAAGDGDSDAGAGDGDGDDASTGGDGDDAGGGGNGPAGLSENQIIWDGETLNLYGTPSCTANPDLVYSGNFSSTDTPALGEELNAVIQFPGQGLPATGDSTGASYSLRPGSNMTGAYVPSTRNNADASVFHVENIDDTTFEFTWSDVEMPILGGGTVLSSGWVICEL